MTNNDDGDRPRNSPARRSQGMGLALPGLVSRGPIGNLLGRMRLRDKTDTVKVDTEGKKVLTENMKVTQELLDEAMRTKLAVDHFNHETPNLIEEQRAAAQHEREQRERRRRIEAAKTYSDLSDIEARNERSRERRKLNDETLIERAATKKAEAETTRKVAQSTDEELQRARKQAEIDAYKSGDFKKLNDLYAADRIAAIRDAYSPVSQSPVDDELDGLEAELDVAKKKLARALTETVSNDVELYLRREIAEIEDAIEKAQTTTQVP